ncbi:MAG: BLUF domain-containing protein [Methylococcaceae bacterium]
MIRLTYASTAVTDFSPEKLVALLKICRINNITKNITGILLYAQGTFFQVLEGDEVAVDAIFEAIKKDKRHKDVTLIEQLPITERLFPYWSMGFDKLEAKELSEMEGFSHFLEKDLTPAGFAAHKHLIEPLLAYLHSKLVNKPFWKAPSNCPYSTKSCLWSTKIRIYNFCIAPYAWVLNFWLC